MNPLDQIEAALDRAGLSSDRWLMEDLLLVARDALAALRAERGESLTAGISDVQQVSERYDEEFARARNQAREQYLRLCDLYRGECVGEGAIVTDQEVICARMEPKPLLSEGAMQEARQPYPYWWTVHDEIAGEWQPRILSLDALREVEARLTYAQWSDYSHDLGFASFGEPVVRAKLLIHASAEQKIEALAAILRNNAHAKGTQ